jgi:formylglycine-generating enzyme required for sulfatase activity
MSITTRIQTTFNPLSRKFIFFWLTEPELEETLRVIRGGFWLSHTKHCRSAYRDSCEAQKRSSVIGFRVVCEV